MDIFLKITTVRKIFETQKYFSFVLVLFQNFKSFKSLKYFVLVLLKNKNEPNTFTKYFFRKVSIRKSQNTFT